MDPLFGGFITKNLLIVNLSDEVLSLLIIEEVVHTFVCPEVRIKRLRQLSDIEVSITRPL